MEQSITLLAIIVLTVWILRKSLNVWTQTAEDKSKVSAMKVSLQNRKDESEIVAEAKELLVGGYEGINKDMEAFILHGRPMPTKES